MDAEGVAGYAGRHNVAEPPVKPIRSSPFSIVGWSFQYCGMMTLRYVSATGPLAANPLAADGSTATQRLQRVALLCKTPMLLLDIHMRTRTQKSETLGSL